MAGQVRDRARRCGSRVSNRQARIPRSFGPREGNLQGSEERPVLDRWSSPPPPSPLPSPPPVDPLDKFEAIGGRAAAGGSSLVTRAALVLYFPSASLGVAMGCRFRRHLFARSSRGGDGGFAIVARISPFIERGGGGDD